MTDLPTRIREACATVAAAATSVAIVQDRIPAYAGELELPAPEPAPVVPPGDLERTAAFWLTLDAINFGSGWFPTLRKPAGLSGYRTVERGIRNRFAVHGPWSPLDLARITAPEIAETLGQDPDHELMALFAASLRDLGRNIHTHGGFTGIVGAARGSAVAFAERLASWECFADVSTYAGHAVPFYKRAQIAAADLARAGVPIAAGLDRLTMFADNLVPHVLRLDGVLAFASGLVDRIEHHELIVHGSREEVEIRACALHAVELIVESRPEATAAQIDELLWARGAGPRYKARPRHRSRCTAY